MPSSDAAADDDSLRHVSSSSPSGPLSGASDTKSHEQIGGDDEDDEEFEIVEEIEEEVEVETEEEVEEEMEVEEEEEDDEKEGEEEECDDSFHSLIPPGGDHNDLSQGKESERHKEQHSVQREESCVKDEDPDISEFALGKPMGMAEENRSQECGKENGFQECAADEEDAGARPEKIVSNSHIEEHCYMNIDLLKPEAMTACTSNRSSVPEREVASVRLMRDTLHKESNDALQYKQEIMQMDTQFEEELKQRASRSGAPRRRPRSFAPSAEFKDGNKRPAATCNFFARGWCIKGSSCRFLHRKDDLDNTSQQHENDIAVANQKRELEVDEGSRDIIERSRLLGSPKLRASSIGNKISSPSHHLSSESITSLKHDVRQSSHESHEKHKISLDKGDDITFGISHEHEQLSLPKGDPRSISSFMDVVGENKRCANDYGKYALSITESSFPVTKNGLLPGYGSLPGSTGISLSTYQSSGLSCSFTSNLEGLATFSSQHMSNNHKSPVLGSPLSSGLDTFHLTNTLSSREYPRSCSPFSGSEPATFHQTKDSRDPQNSTVYKTKVSSNDWVPSARFRPSFFAVPPSILSPGRQYDPLRDSIEQSRVGDNIFPSGHEASIPSTPLQQINEDPVFTGLPGSELNADKHFYHKFHDNVSDKNCATHGNELFTTTAGIGGTSIAEMESRNIVPNKEMWLGSADVKEDRKLDQFHVEQDSRHKSSGVRRKELKTDTDAQSNDAYVDSKTGRDGQKASKALRHFRAAVVDVVKELVKPTWREGHLSKDAHKMIVKKAVDKVLNTLHPDQIPSTMDAVKQYLSLSRPKMLKLVEGYVEKYGKP